MRNHESSALIYAFCGRGAITPKDGKWITPNRGRTGGNLELRIRREGMMKKTGKVSKTGLKRRRPRTTILKWFESSCHSPRDRVHNSNFILFKIPIQIKVLEHGEKFTVIDDERASSRRQKNR
jgi:hypothetical protein